MVLRVPFAVPPVPLLHLLTLGWSKRVRPPPRVPRLGVVLPRFLLPALLVPLLELFVARFAELVLPVWPPPLWLLLWRLVPLLVRLYVGHAG